MTTQYTTILKLALPVEGELSGTWGDVVNDNITQMVEQAVAGKAVVNTWSGNSHTLTTADGTTSESRCAILELTDTNTQLSGVGNVVCPANTKLYIVDNNTARVITVKTASGSGVAVPVGKTMLVYCDGTNVVEGVTHANSLSLGTSTVTADKILDEDNMSSNSATAIATQQSIKAYVDSQVGTVDTLAEILANGNTTGSTDIEVTTAQKVQFRDAAIYINSSADGQLDIVADGEVQIATALVDINGNLDVSGTTNISGSTSFTKNAIASVAISGVARSSNTVTVTTSAVHGLSVSDVVNLNGVTDISFNGYFTVTAVSSTTVFTFSQTAANASSSGGSTTEIVYNLNASGTALNQMNGPLNITANSPIDGLEITQSGAGNGLHVTGTTDLVGNTTLTGNIATSGDYSSTTAGTSNLRLGVNAGNSIASGGNYNVVVGDEAGTAITTGDSNVAIGYQALDAEDTGSSSVAVGYNALSTQNNDGSNLNTAVGYSAGGGITTGIHNTLLGGSAGDALTDADYNVAVGVSSLGADTLGSHSVAIGRRALKAQNFTSATDTYNVAVGSSAGELITTGVQNTIIGGLAGDAMTTGNRNTALGYSALSSDTLGDRNVAIGNLALQTQNFTSSTDSYNTAVGYMQVE